MSSFYTMPKVDVSALDLTAEERAIVEIVVKSDGTIRASCPPMPKKSRIKDEGNQYGYHFDYKDDAGRLAGRAAFVWRWIVFMASPNPKHQCMPCTEQFYLPYAADRRAQEQVYQALADKILGTIPAHEQHGLRRWGRALGVSI